MSAILSTPLSLVDWGTSVLIGLGLYYWSGRRQIARDWLWRRACRFGIPLLRGMRGRGDHRVTVSVVLFSLGQVWLALLTFSLVYIWDRSQPGSPLE